MWKLRYRTIRFSSNYSTLDGPLDILLSNEDSLFKPLDKWAEEIPSYLTIKNLYLIHSFYWRNNNRFKVQLNTITNMQEQNCSFSHYRLSIKLTTTFNWHMRKTNWFRPRKSCFHHYPQLYYNNINFSKSLKNSWFLL